MVSKISWYSEKQERSVLSTVLPWLSALGVLVALIGPYVEWRVRSIVGDPEFKKEIARRVRPSLVFNSEGVVSNDTGALELLESVPEVRKAPKDDHTFFVTIRPKAWLAAEPILESLDIGAVSVTLERLPGTAWKMTVSARTSYLALQSQPTKVALPRFRLELNPP